MTFINRILIIMIMPILIIMISMPLKAQDYESLTEDPPSGGLKSDGIGCDDWLNFTPIDLNQVSIKRVSITLHVFQKNDGTGNFEDNESSRNWLTNNVIGNLNSVMGNLCEMNLSTTSSFITDSRVRFVVEDIFFHQDTYGWNLYCVGYTCNINSTLGNYLYTTYVINNPEVTNKYNSVHIFLGENQTGKGQASNIGDKKWILMSGTYYHYLNSNFWSPGNGIRHELGHCLGLLHTWGLNNDLCSDTPGAPENNNCWNGDTCSNNVMDYNASKCALTECQFGRIHWYLMGHAGNISDCLINDYLTYDESKSIIINNSQSNTWEFEQFIIGDLIIRSNSSLTIKCTITLSPGGTIEVEDGSTLVIDGGKIENANVIVNSGGIFNIINGGELVTTSDDEIYISGGAILNFSYGSIE